MPKQSAAGRPRTPAQAEGDHGERFRWFADAIQGGLADDPDGPVKRLALVQTPGFVGEFLLDRTLEPALTEFGPDGFRLIDPTCGGGHLLCQAFDRLFRAWGQRRPDMPRLDRARRAVASVYGVDLDPTNVAVSRFRLTVAACDAAGVLPYDAAAWGLQINVGWADALLPADHEVQPYFRRPDSLRAAYGEYTTRDMLRAGPGEDAHAAWAAFHPDRPQVGGVKV